jgi:CheY-like chemotaxis protein
MSHELRSPLNAMLGFSRLLLREASLGAHSEELSIIMRSGEQLNALIGQVLEMAKLEAGTASLVESVFDLHAMLDELREAFAPAAQAKGLQLGVGCDAAVPKAVRGDARKLRKVLGNLLGNAVKFTRQGTVGLHVGAQPRENGFLFDFGVSDTGVGIDADELSVLGHAFQQARAGQLAAEGTGLGLAISRGFVRLMGGDLRLTSTPGAGTCARFAIAMHAVDGMACDLLPRPRGKVLRLAPGTPAPRILVVDDRADGRLLLMRTLAPLGFQVRQAADGEQAVQAWEQWSPQLILMDMRMPVMDGWEATRRIKTAQHGQVTVVVALTASSFEEERAQILAGGCDDFMRKPFQEDVLLDMLARHLGLEYEYEDTATPQDKLCETDAACVARLPSVLQQRFRVALERLDVQAVDDALDAVAVHDADIAAVLAPLVLEFRYEEILALLPQC